MRATISGLSLVRGITFVLLSLWGIGPVIGFDPPMVESDEDKPAYTTDRLWMDARNHPEWLESEIPEIFKGIVVDAEGFRTLQFHGQKTEKIVAFQVENIQQLTDHPLPATMSLASVMDSSTLFAFHNHIVNQCHQSGIDYLIPVKKNGSKAAQLFWSRFRAQHPTFFISDEKFTVPSNINKKALKALLQEEKIILTSRDAASRYAKLLKRIRGRFNPLPYKKGEPLYLSTIPEVALYQKLREQAAVSLSQGISILPLKTSKVAFYGPSNNSALRQELAKYFQVVSASSTLLNENTPIIIDSRHSENLPEAEFSNYPHQRIALISSETQHIPAAEEYLFLPENTQHYDELIPQMLFGAIGISGSFQGEHPFLLTLKNTTIPSSHKLKYTSPEREGMKPLTKIKEIIEEMIEQKAAPGCQITVVKNGSIVYNEAFGYLTYDSITPVNENILYDVASLTKVMSTTLALMHLEERGAIRLDDTLGTYLPIYRGSNKGNISIRQLLAHQGGLRAYEALWQRTIPDDLLDPFIYKTAEDEANDIRTYLSQADVIKDSIRMWLINSPLLKNPNKYRYSDLGFMILQQVIESVSKTPINQYVAEHFYHPMGLKHTLFNPIYQFDFEEIAPTEFDHYYRNKLVWGEVHDRNAALFGGVAGHAGLFSSAEELAILMQMLLQEGDYAGRQYLKPETIKKFNQQYFPDNRRALGWDKYSQAAGNASHHVSYESFGHTGFTGTIVWADPAENLVFSFVSNRVHPSADNKKLIHLDTRTRIHDLIYESILK